MSRARYELIQHDDAVVLIKDVGHDSGCPTVTNDAEAVVAELAPMLNGRALHYIDSDGNVDELKVKDGRFAGFAPVRQVTEEEDDWYEEMNRDYNRDIANSLRRFG